MAGSQKFVALHEAIGSRSEPWQKVPGATGELK